MGTSTTWKTSSRLADGREIIYFDEAPGLGRAQARDTRPLAPRLPGPPLPAGLPESGIRWDALAFPAVRVPDLPSVGEEAREAFGPLYLDVLRRFDALFGRPAPYIACWHQAPVTDVTAREAFAAHLQVLSVRRAADKLKYLAGAESGMGVWINDIVPEHAAQRLREA